MTIVRSPLFTELRDKIADLEFRMRRNKKIELAKKRVPSNPRTFKQRVVRQTYRQCLMQYHQLTDEEKAYYVQKYRKENLDTYRAFMKECLSQNLPAAIYEITIDNSANQNELTDFQVLLNINGDSQFFQDCQNNQYAFYFMDEDLTAKIPFYREEWDTVNYNARIWLKVPSIPSAGKVKLYMLINPNRTIDESNPDAVFEFFDDIEVWEGWEKVGSGVVSQSSEHAFEGMYSLKKDKYGDPNGGRKALSRSLDRSGYIFEAYVRRNTIDTANRDRFGLEDANGNGYSFDYNHDSGSESLIIDIRTNGRPTEAGKVSAPQILGEWYIGQLIIYGSTVKARILRTDLSLVAETSITDTTYSTFTYVYVRGGYPYYLDLIKVRKYTEQEPNVTYTKL